MTKNIMYEVDIGKSCLDEIGANAALDVAFLAVGMPEHTGVWSGGLGHQQACVDERVDRSSQPINERFETAGHDVDCQDTNDSPSMLVTARRVSQLGL
ncbi:hypothetical protein NOR_04421 [Metarhizium rileyi]|uniref:Uncharacterized protein n=1 Tax=Metarhizium rileyi (strain RCEF 4871) TaxID=1649241 RepID=A0A167EFM5_METRR|nr:hypothetical protein NOR_04421 [Metarhizium rileyi RCEF 4871]